MAEIDTTQDRRCRGRPQVRPDDETRGLIYEAARHEFAGRGYAATGMEAVARRAGVSTKTLYRLIPNKASLFDGMVTDRLDRTLAKVDLRVTPIALDPPSFFWSFGRIIEPDEGMPEQKSSYTKRRQPEKGRTHTPRPEPSPVTRRYHVSSGINLPAHSQPPPELG